MYCDGSITIIWNQRFDQHIPINFLASKKSVWSGDQSSTCASSQSVSTLICC